jgi:hypothetical protein
MGHLPGPSGSAIPASGQRPASETFNANPYLATVAMGVALRMEEEIARGAAGAERRLTRLLRALRGSLGAIGDDLFWASWRPALGIAAALAALATGSVWPTVVYVLAWTSAQVTAGVRAGPAGVARVLQDPFWAGARNGARRGGAFAAGAALGAGVAWSASGGGGWGGVAIFFAIVALVWLAGTRVGSRGRLLPPAFAFLVVVAILGAIHHWTGGTLP